MPGTWLSPLLYVWAPVAAGSKTVVKQPKDLRGVQSQHAFPFVHLQSAGQFRCSELDSGLPEGSVVSGVWARQLGRP